MDKKVVSEKDFLTERLKKEIDLLFDRLFFSAQRENIALKKEICYLKAENERLIRKLSVKSGGITAFFNRETGGFGTSFLDR